jgi:fructosamine-3-kinase
MRSDEQLAAQLSDILGEPVVRMNSVGGGCIANAQQVRLESGRLVFTKTSRGGEPMFRCEANGLRELAKAAAIRVPDVIHATDHLLVIEHIESGSRPGDFMDAFGRQFAAMHRHTAETFGFHEDNYLGSSVQKNTPQQGGEGAWPAFFFENRLLFQLQLAERGGRATAELRGIIGAIETRIDDLLAGSDEPPTLLHGDLWGGNYMVAEDGAPCLIDPAVYYGHREADLAMTRLFGGFNHRFYQAYEEAFPLPEGADDRAALYEAYHILNHLNLFGSSYYSQAVGLLRRYAR